MPFDRSAGTLRQPASHFDDTWIDINAHDCSVRTNSASSHLCSNSGATSYIEHALSGLRGNKTHDKLSPMSEHAWHHVALIRPRYRRVDRQVCL
jgi:hypothetical protein